MGISYASSFFLEQASGGRQIAISGLDKAGGIRAVEDVGVVAKMALMVGVRE